MDNIQDFKNFLHANLYGYVGKAMLSKNEAESFFKTFKKELNDHVWELLDEHNIDLNQINAAIKELTCGPKAFGGTKNYCRDFITNLKTHVESTVFEHSN